MTDICNARAVAWKYHFIYAHTCTQSIFIVNTSVHCWVKEIVIIIDYIYTHINEINIVYQLLINIVYNCIFVKRIYAIYVLWCGYKTRLRCLEVIEQVCQC